MQILIIKIREIENLNEGVLVDFCQLFLFFNLDLNSMNSQDEGVKRFCIKIKMKVKRFCIKIVERISRVDSNFRK